MTRNKKNQYNNKKIDELLYIARVMFVARHNPTDLTFHKPTHYNIKIVRIACTSFIKTFKGAISLTIMYVDDMILLSITVMSPHKTISC